MSIDYGYILAAGMGTRMGEIGKRVPKVLWRLFDKALIDYQVFYLKSLGCQKIFLNTHYLADKIESYCQEKKLEGVELIHEPVLLGPGGCVHNLVRKLGVHEGTILINNADQFYFFNPDYMNEALDAIDTVNVVLFNLNVAAGAHYNETVFEEGLLREIKKGNQKENYQTFSGMSLVNISHLELVDGASNYFTTVAPYKSSPVKGISVDQGVYYDFGSVPQYYQTCWNLADDLKKGESSPLLALIKAAGGIPDPSFYEGDVLLFDGFQIGRDQIKFEDILIDLADE